MAKNSPISQDKSQIRWTDMYLVRLLPNFSGFTWISQLCVHAKFQKHFAVGRKQSFFNFRKLRVKNLLLKLSSIKFSLQIQESVCSVVKYFYNSPHVFYCKLQSDNARWKTLVWPKMVCVRAKIGLTGQLDCGQPGNYFKPWNVNFFNAEQLLFCTRC